MKMCEGKCVICGESFVYDKGNRITCSSECCAERNRIMTREYKRKVRQNQTTVKPPKKKKKTKSNLNKDLKAARELGMSYGMYKAVMGGDVDG